MDWVKTGWGNISNQIPNLNLPFVIDFSNGILSPRQPMVDIISCAIQRIIESYPPPYTLLVSGGIDSQVMILSWLMSGYSFSMVSIRFNKQLNEYDLKTLRLFTSLHKLDVNYLEFDIISFFENRLTKYAVMSQCASPQICAHMCASEMITSGTVLMSGNFLRPESCGLDYTLYGLHRYRKHTNRSMIPFFLQHDRQLSTVAIPFSNLNKIALYQKLGFEIVPQEKSFGGFEGVKEYYEQFSGRVPLKEKIKHSGKQSRLVFDHLFTYPLTTIIDDTKRVKYIQPMEFANGVG